VTKTELYANSRPLLTIALEHIRDPSAFFKFYSQALLENISIVSVERQVVDNLINHNHVAESTYNMTVIDGCIQARNGAQTFETLRSCYGVRAPGCYAYAITLQTGGLLQIGWATQDCQVDPEGGTGIGDDEYSYAYDGVRCKKWHGLYPKNVRGVV
jgi:hypothetical protein